MKIRIIGVAHQLTAIDRLFENVFGMSGSVYPSHRDPGLFRWYVDVNERDVRHALLWMQQRLAEPNMVAHDERQLWWSETERADRAEAKLQKLRDAHARYQRDDLSQEEFEGTVAALAEDA